MSLTVEQQMIARMSQFLPDYYHAIHPDVKKDKVFGKDASGAFLHYTRHGMGEKRRPNPWFDPKFYQQKYSHDPKIKAMTGEQLYEHWTVHGIREGRAGTAFFDSTHYLQSHADLVKVFGSVAELHPIKDKVEKANRLARGFNHWWTHGNPEARATGPNKRILRIFAPKKGSTIHFQAAEGDTDAEGLGEKLDATNTTGGQIGFVVGVAVGVFFVKDPTLASAVKAGLLGAAVGHALDRVITKVQNEQTGPMWHQLEQGPIGKALGHWEKMAEKGGGHVGDVIGGFFGQFSLLGPEDQLPPFALD